MAGVSDSVKPLQEAIEQENAVLDLDGILDTAA
jgi:hypothetical protein